MIRSLLFVTPIALLTCMNANADIVNITIQGTVDYSVIQGNQTTVPDGAPVIMSFNVDSNVYTNSGSFPTRGYNIDLASWSMTVGGQPINLLNPQQNNAPAYFVLRDNDPAVDGFFISPGTDWQFPINALIPGLTPVHELNFLATYGNTTTLSSLNILDAVGTYDFTGISVYTWWIGRFGNPGAEYIYDSMTISVVPGPASLATLGLLCGFMPKRRRRQS